MSEAIAVPETGLILPPGLTKAPEVDREYEAAEDKAKALPDPKGWRILCALVEAGDSYDSGIVKADQTVKLFIQITL